MNEIVILDVIYTFGNRTESIHPVILRDGSDVVLVDCAYPGFLPKLQAAAEEKGISLKTLTKVIITHHDYDHVGALAELKEAYPHIKVLATKAEAPYIEGTEKSLRLRQAEGLYEFLPEEQKEGARYLQKLFSSVPTAKVDVILQGDEVFPWCGGCVVVPTPGHMPGHISLYLPERKTLISGDALAIGDGKLGIANPEFTLDMEAAKQSIRKLLEYDIEKIICYHGGIYEQDIKKALIAILE